MKIEDGWHKLDELRDYLVEDGYIIRGTYCNGLDCRTIFPYKRYAGGLDLWQPKATKANLKKIFWR